MLMVQTRGEIWLKMQNARCALQNRTSCSRLGPAPRKRVTKEPVSTRGKTDAQAICLPPKEEDFNQPTLRRFTDNWHSLLHLFPCLSYSALKPLQLVCGQHSWGLGLDISFIEKKKQKIISVVPMWTFSSTKSGMSLELCPGQSHSHLGRHFEISTSAWTTDLL